METKRTLYGYLHDLAARRPDWKLLGTSAGWITVSEAKDRVLRSMSDFFEEGVRPGDYVALSASRSPETAIAIWGLELLGAVSVLVDPREDMERWLHEEVPEIPIRAYLRPNAEDPSERLRFAENAAPTASSDVLPPCPEDVANAPADLKKPAYVIFTSGSTGKSKAVVLSAYSLCKDILDAMPLGWYEDEDIALGVLPLTHVFGMLLLTGTLVRGYAVFFPESADITLLLDAIDREGITRINGVPSLYFALAARKGEHSLKSLHVGFIGGGPWTPEQLISTEKTLGMILVPAYGMSECVGITLGSFMEPVEKRAETVGRFYEGALGKVLREDGSEADLYEEGEICIDSETRMIGYFGEEEPGYDPCAPVGTRPLLHTGDLGFVDNAGYVHITGRKKDIIIRNGNNLSARRIEEALLSVPGVHDAAVIGLRDEREGEIPYAMYSGSISPEALGEMLKPLLHKNEWPAGLLQEARLPLTAAGKTDKKKVKEVLGKWKAGRS